MPKGLKFGFSGFEPVFSLFLAIQVQSSGFWEGSKFGFSGFEPVFAWPFSSHTGSKFGLLGGVLKVQSLVLVDEPGFE